MCTLFWGVFSPKMPSCPQFVAMNDHVGSGAASGLRRGPAPPGLVRELLGEMPGNLMAYMKAHGIQPNPPGAAQAAADAGPPGDPVSYPPQAAAYAGPVALAEAAPLATGGVI